MKRNWFAFTTKLSGIRSRGYIAVLAAAAVVCSAGLWEASKLRINGDISTMLPEDAPSVKSLDDMTRRFGATNFLIILFLAPKDRPLARDLEALARDLARSEHIKRVDYRWEVKDLETQGLYYLNVDQLEEVRDTIKEKIRQETLKNSGFYVELDEEEEVEEDDLSDMSKAIEEYGEGLVLEGDYVYFRKDVDCRKGRDGKESCDRAVWGMIVTPSQGAADVTYASKLIKEARRIVEAQKLDRSVRVLFSGRYNYLATEASLILADLGRVSLYGSALVALIVFLFFPNIFSLILIFIPLLVGIALDFGIVHLTIGELNVVTTGNFAILFGTGSAYGVHIYSRFREESKRGHSYEDAMDSAVGDTGRASYLSAATTAFAFLSLTVAEYRGFVQLGFITFMGVCFAFIAAIVILPALGKLLSKLRLLRRHRFTGLTIDDVLRRRGEPPRGWLYIAAGGVLLSAVSVYYIASFRDVYEVDYNKLQWADEERELAHRYEMALFGMSGEPAVLAADSRDDLLALVDRIERMKGAEGKGTIDKVDSILSFVPKDQEAKQEVIREIAKVVNQKKMDLAEGETLDQVKRLRRLAAAEPVTLDTLPEDIRMRFQSEDGGYLVFVYPTHDINDLRYALELRDLLSGPRLGREFGGTNPGILFAEMQEVMLGDAPRVITIAFLVVMLIVLIDFLSVRDTALALVPLVTGIIWMIGIQSAFHIKLNWISAIAYPAVIGIGVDNGVHVMHRYRMEGPASLRRLVRNLGRTLSVSTLTAVAGFGTLMLSHHPGLKSLGLLTMIGLISTYLAAVVFLPVIIFIYEMARTRLRLARRSAITVWTVSFDPATRRVVEALRRRGADFKVICLDEMPLRTSAREIETLRRRAGCPLRVPLVEEGDRIVAADPGSSIRDIRPG